LAARRRKIRARRAEAVAMDAERAARQQ